MKKQGCRKHHFKKIAIFAFFIFLFAGTLDTLLSGQTWYIHYFRSFVFTATTTFFCTFLICRFVETISQYPRIIYYLLFSIIVVVGVFLGVLAGTLILDQTLFINLKILQFSLLIGFVASVIITAYIFFRENLEIKITQLKEVEIENERLQRFELQARLSSLQAKLNPHFLFNTLNSTAALIYDNPKKAEESIVRLSDLYRKIFSISNQNFIRLKEEIELIEDMLELEKLRFEDDLSYRVDCPASLQETKIPGLLIEPLVENVIKHVYSRNQQNIRIEIKIEQKDENLFIGVEDNGMGFDVGKTDPGYGLYSIQERLRLLFGDNAGIDIDSEVGRGTKVKIWMPV